MNSTSGLCVVIVVITSNEGAISLRDDALCNVHRVEIDGFSSFRRVNMDCQYISTCVSVVEGGEHEGQEGKCGLSEKGRYGRGRSVAVSAAESFRIINVVASPFHPNLPSPSWCHAFERAWSFLHIRFFRRQCTLRTTSSIHDHECVLHSSSFSDHLPVARH